MLLSGHCSVWELSQATSSKCQPVATAWQPPAAPPAPKPLPGPPLPHSSGGGILPALPPASPARRQQDVARHPTTRRLTPSPAVTPHAGSTLPKPKEAANLSGRCKHSQEPQAAPAPTLLCCLPSWESRAELGNIHRQSRETKCPQDQGITQPQPCPHLNTCFLPRPSLTL